MWECVTSSATVRYIYIYIYVPFSVISLETKALQGKKKERDAKLQVRFSRSSYS